MHKSLFGYALEMNHSFWSGVVSGIIGDKYDADNQSQLHNLFILIYLSRRNNLAETPLLDQDLPL